MAFSKTLYFAALLPSPQIKEEILQLKLEIKEKFNVSHALKLPAHITILPPFWLENDKENDLLKMIEQRVRSQHPFQIELKDFGHFGQRVLYIGLEDPEPVKKVYDHFSPIRENFLKDSTSSSIHPHVTIATRDLTREKFKEAWEIFKFRSYSNSFEAKELVLFKHNGKSWDIFKEFPFVKN